MLSLCFIAAIPWPPPQMPTAEEFKQIQNMAKASGIAPSAKVGAEVFAAAQPTQLSAEEQKAALDRFKNAWFIGSKFFGKQQVEVDAFLLPSADLAKVTYQWTSATGKEAMLGATQVETLDVRSGQAFIPLKNPDDDSATVETAKAKVTVEVPTGFDEVTLPCAAPKKEVLGKLSFTLERCDKDVFTVLVDGFDEGDELIPLNAQKRALESGESSRAPLFSGKSIEELTYEEFKKGPGTLTRAIVRAKGTVAFVRWRRPKAMKKTELEITATKEPQQETYGPSSRVRYAAPSNEPASFASLDPAALTLSFVSGRVCAMFGYNAPKVWLVMPAVANSLLAQVEMPTPPKVKGGKGTFELETNGMDARTYRYGWTLSNKKDTPFVFATADVSATVKYPMKIEARAITKISGNKVTVELADGEELTHTSGLLAFDAGGRALKQFSNAEGSDNAMVYAFMGPVAKVTANVVQTWVERKVTGKLKPSPLRPKDRAGSCDD